MMPMKEETLMRRLEELAPFANRTEARRALDAVLQAMRRGMNEDEADWLAVALGPGLSAPLLRESYAGELDERELYRWTKRHGKQRKGVAVEQAQVVCRALGELLPPSELERLERHLPELAPLFRARGAAEAARAPRRNRGDLGAHTLSAEQPGSEPPPSEGLASNEASGSARAERTQPHSLARAREPHNDTGVAGGPGLGSEGRSLATAGQRRR